VDIPEQDITNGVVQIVVVEGVLDKLTLKGNKWFSDSSYLNKIHIKSGDVIDSRRLLQDIAWINRNPFRHVDALFSPGAKEGTTDVELLAKDRFPLRVYVGGDNTGNRGTGEARYFTGFNWGNAFNSDQLLNYQYTVGPNFHRFQSHTIDYLAPLPWRHIFELYGGYSIVHPHVTGFHSKGHSAQASMRYHMPVGLLYKNYDNEFVLGADFKNMNNNLEFRDDAEAPVFNSIVNITQAVFGYDFGYRSKHQSISFNPQVYWSPGDLISHQSEHAYNKMRPHAKNHYVYGTLALGDDFTVGKGYVFSFLTRFQGATATLLPSEQFALGGYDTVRGYDEREVNVDNGFCGNFETRMRPFNVFSKKDALVLLGFFDYGIGSNIHPLRGENKWHYLMGVGPGLRYQLERYISLRLDIGYRLHKTQFGPSPGFKVHFGMIASY
jgi:hemolysin activation/secretion protein